MAGQLGVPGQVVVAQRLLETSQLVGVQTGQARHRLAHGEVPVGTIGVGEQHQVGPALPDGTDGLGVPARAHFELDPSIALFPPEGDLVEQRTQGRREAYGDAGHHLVRGHGTDAALAAQEVGHTDAAGPLLGV